MIKHSQYFTAAIYSSALVSAIDINNVNNILDLGIGDGSLSYASLSRWPQAHITAFDIDENICNKYTGNSQIEVMKEDVLSNTFCEIYSEQKFDLAICNPPFAKIKKRDIFDSLFEKANLTECKQIKQLTADLLFLTINLIQIKKGGYCAIILPDGPLTRIDYKPFRKALLSNYRILKILELPDKSFRGTEARTHILIIRKEVPINSYTELSLMGPDGEIIDSLYVPQEDLVFRLDFTYNKWKHKTPIENIGNNLKIDIKRGSFTYKELRESTFRYIHSNSFNDGDVLEFEESDYSQMSSKVIATAGDIIMCRVGKRCVGKIGYVKSGKVLLSDCLYKISVPQSCSKQLFGILKDRESKEWVKISAHGVCSKVISKTDLLWYASMRITSIM